MYAVICTYKYNISSTRKVINKCERFVQKVSDLAQYPMPSCTKVKNTSAEKVLYEHLFLNIFGTGRNPY